MYEMHFMLYAEPGTIRLLKVVLSFFHSTFNLKIAHSSALNLAENLDEKGLF